jgi:hypothetical protein
MFLSMFLSGIVDASFCEVGSGGFVSGATASSGASSLELKAATLAGLPATLAGFIKPASVAAFRVGLFPGFPKPATLAALSPLKPATLAAFVSSRHSLAASSR